VYYVDPTAAPVAAAAKPVAEKPAATTATSSNTSVATTQTASVQILPGAALPFSDDFEGYLIGAAMPVSAADHYGRVNFPGARDKGSVAAQVDETADPTGKFQKALALTGDTNLTIGDSTWGNYSLSFDAVMPGKTSCDSLFQIILNLSPEGKNFLVLNTGLGSDANASLSKTNGSQFVNVASRSGLGFSFKDKAWRKFLITNKDGLISAKIDGRTIIEYKDSDARFQKGGIGFGVHQDCGELLFLIDNLKIEALK
jgi:hypothetical protein